MYLAVVLAAAVFYVFYDGYISMYLLRVMLALPVVSLVISLPSVLTARLSITAGTAAHKGDEIPLKIVVANHLPTFGGKCRVTLKTTNGFSGDFFTEKLSLPFGCKALTVSHRLKSSSCGRVVCRLAHARTSDCLGLITLPLRLEKPQCVISFYPTVDGARLVLHKNAAVDESGERYSPTQAGDDPTEIFGFREYREGDRISRINYKLSEKLGTTVVREFSQPATSRRLLLLCLGGTIAEKNSQLDAHAAVAGFLIKNGGCAFALCDENAPVLTGELNTEDEFFRLYDFIFECGTNLPQTEKTQLPQGFSAVYICAKPTAELLDSLAKTAPQAIVTVLHTEPLTENTILPENVESAMISHDGTKTALDGIYI